VVWALYQNGERIHCMRDRHDANGWMRQRNRREIDSAALRAQCAAFESSGFVAIASTAEKKCPATITLNAASRLLSRVSSTFFATLMGGADRD
jgi:hypothetical protein